MMNIWCYWSQGEHNMPELEKLCLKSWRKHISKEFKINICNKNMFLEIQDEINENLFNQLTFQQQSDYVRLFLLYHFGGIYIDLRCILTDDFKWATDKFEKGYNIVSFKVNYPFMPKNDMLMENWFIAVKNKNNYIIKTWKEVFLELLYQIYNNNLDYNKSHIWSKTNKSYIFPSSRYYLTQHIAHLYNIENNYKYKEEFKSSAYLYNANTTALIDPFMNVNKYINILLFGIGYNNDFPLIKITRHDKKYIKYYCSINLKNIINKELETEFIKNTYIQRIIVIIIIIIIYCKKKIIVRFF